MHFLGLTLEAVRACALCLLLPDLRHGREQGVAEHVEQVATKGIDQAEIEGQKCNGPIRRGRCRNMGTGQIQCLAYFQVRRDCATMSGVNVQDRCNPALGSHRSAKRRPMRLERGCNRSSKPHPIPCHAWEAA